MQIELDINRIRARAAAANVTLNVLCRKADVDASTLWRRTINRKGGRLSTFEKLNKALLQIEKLAAKKQARCS